jgi:hypothetical protein
VRRTEIPRAHQKVSVGCVFISHQQVGSSRQKDVQACPACSSVRFILHITNEEHGSSILVIPILYSAQAEREAEGVGVF